jgi:hypothetical protein
VVLIAEGVNEEIKRKFAETEPKEITKRCQEVVEKSKIGAEKPTLIGANKLSNNIVKLQCKSPENANKLRVNDVKWNLANEGLTTRKVKYGIVVHCKVTSGFYYVSHHETPSTSPLSRLCLA